MRAWPGFLFRRPKATANHIPTLDGLRAVAILLVIFADTVELREHPTLVTLGHVGVPIFFALSGYLIHQSVGAGIQGHRANLTSQLLH
jgi:peptidoglycan/LPS O-acetylase OafA/YrhL